MSYNLSKRLLQAVILLLGLVPIVTGALGAIQGPSSIVMADAWPLDLDSQFRYLSGILMGVGIAYYTTIPAIERKTTLFRLLTLMVFIGGLGRLYALLTLGAPSRGHVIGIGLELVVVPLLALWQTFLARQGRN